MGKEIDKLTSAVKETLGTGFIVRFQEIEKNNGLVLQAITIREKEDAACSVIYVDQFLDEIENGEISLCNAVSRIINTYTNSQDGDKLSEIVRNLNKEKILSSVTCQIINLEKNAGRLTRIPHEEFLDLAVIYRVRMDKENTYSFTITGEICRKYSISLEDLHIAAVKNMEKEGFTVQTLASVIEEITGMQEETISENCFTAYVLTNKSRLDGATVMMYGKHFSRIARKLNTDLYVLPSSIHEVLAVPDDGINPYELKTIVHDVNSGVVSDDEILSENIYRYSMEKDTFEIVKN